MIRFGVIGAGRIGKVHSKTIASNPKAKLCYIADAMPAAESLAQQYAGPEARRCRHSIMADGQTCEGVSKW